MPDPQEPNSSPNRRATAMLAIGAGLGLALAAWGLLGEVASARLPEGAVARVNGTAIRVEDFDRLVAAVLKDMRTPDRKQARKRVLDRMIEEELLVQRALDLGLVHLDRKVRADLTSSVITSVVNDVENREPSDDELEEFFAENKEYFTRPGRLRAREIYFRERESTNDPSTPATPSAPTAPSTPSTALERAEAAHARLTSGDAFETVKAELGDFEISPIPNALLPATKLREYVGPTVLRIIDALEVGEWSPPTRTGNAMRIVQLIERENATTPALSTIRAQVETDWRRRLGDRALRDYLDELRVRAKVEIAEDFE